MYVFYCLYSLQLCANNNQKYFIAIQAFQTGPAMTDEEVDKWVQRLNDVGEKKEGAVCYNFK